MISTSRTQIRPLKEKDFEPLISMYLEPESNKYIAPLRNKNKDFFNEFLNKKLNQNKSIQGFWVVLEKNTNEIIGTVNLNLFQPLTVTHIGCHLKKEFWNKGFASEILRTIIEYGFIERGLEEIYGIVEVDNQVSKKLMKKLEFQFYKAEILDSIELEIYKLKTVPNKT